MNVYVLVDSECPDRRMVFPSYHFNINHTLIEDLKWRFIQNYKDKMRVVFDGSNYIYNRILFFSNERDWQIWHKIQEKNDAAA